MQVGKPSWSADSGAGAVRVDPAAEPVVAPDFAEPFAAWRAWRVVACGDGFRLSSVVKPTLWPAGEPLVAECLRTSSLFARFARRRGGPPQAPEVSCECGIYAASLGQIGQYLVDVPAIEARAVARVLGQVSLWGTVIECERGFRASHAYPVRLYVPVDAALTRDHGWEELVVGLRAYGVPVELLPALCSEAVRTLERRQGNGRPARGRPAIGG